MALLPPRRLLGSARQATSDESRDRDRFHVLCPAATSRIREAWMPPPNAARRSRIRFRWLERGQGSAVVLVHGIPTSAELSRHVRRRSERHACSPRRWSATACPGTRTCGLTSRSRRRPGTSTGSWTSSAASGRCWSATTSAAGCARLPRWTVGALHAARADEVHCLRLLPHPAGARTAACPWRNRSWVRTPSLSL